MGEVKLTPFDDILALESPEMRLAIETRYAELLVEIIATERAAKEAAEAKLDKLYGEKFSDRCYHALKSRAVAAEREVERLKHDVLHYMQATNDEAELHTATQAQLAALRERCEGLADCWHADYSTFARNDAADELRTLLGEAQRANDGRS